MMPYGLLLECAAAVMIAAVFNHYGVYRPDARTAAAWRLFWRGAVASAALSVVEVALGLSAPGRPLLLAGLGVASVAGFVGLLVMAAAGVHVLRHGVHRRRPRLGSGREYQ